MNTIKKVSEILPKTLEILESAGAPPITEKPLNEDKLKAWSKKWLRLRTDHHKLLQQLERTVYRFCRDYAKEPTKGRRLVLCGTNGTGKSHVSKAVARWAIHNAIQLPCVMTEDWFGLSRCRYVFWPEFCDEIKSQGDFDAPVRLMEFQLLVLDDIGAEHDPTRFAMEKLYWLLERREFNWTIITTNVTPSLWQDKFEMRVASRLLRNTEIIDLSDVPDFSTL